MNESGGGSGNKNSVLLEKTRARETRGGELKFFMDFSRVAGA